MPDAPVADDTPPLPAPLADFLQSGVSITVASCNARLVPSIAKAVGCRVDPDRRRVTVLLFEAPAVQVLQDLREPGASLAVCFSRPSTHQTVQLKASQVRVAPAEPGDLEVARRCLALLQADLAPLGFPAPMLEAVFWSAGQPLLALSFEPGDAFAQTPGPDAGREIAR